MNEADVWRPAQADAEWEVMLHRLRRCGVIVFTVTEMHGNINRAYVSTAQLWG